MKVNHWFAQGILSAGVVVLILLASSLTSAQGGAARAAQAGALEPGSRTPASLGSQTRELSDAAIAGRFVAHTSPAMRLSISLLLRGRHLEQIPGLLAAQADPRSPMFRRWLTPQQYGNYFGATPAQVQQTLTFLRSRGFTLSVVTPNNRYIVARAPASTVEATFATPIEMWRSPKGLYYANRFTPVIPAELPWIEGVSGLDSFHQAHSHIATGGVASGHPRPHPQATVLPGHFGFGPQDLYTAYDFNRTYTGTGVTIAIPVVRNFLSTDVFNYNAQFGLSNSTFTKVFLDGTCAAPCPSPTSANDAGETALDTEVSHAAAPSASVIVVAQDDAILPSTVLAFQYIANVLASKVQVVSSSYGLCESSVDPVDRGAMVGAIDQGILEGQTWVVASGDDGSDDCKSGLQDVDFPASSPNIVAAGGTTLNTVNLLGNVVSYNSEYAWNDTGCSAGGATGGGVSRFYGKPAWQNLVTFSDKVRDVPDVAAEADPFQQTQFPATCPAPGGYWVITNGIWAQIGGTSGAAPFWAGVLADLVQEQRGSLGLVLPELYNLKGTTAFHKITIGNNAFAGVPGYSAGAGYNRATGLGSPDETQLIAKFAEARPPTPKPTSFPGLFPHSMATPAAKPTARAFIPILISASKAANIGVFDATVGATQGKQVQIIPSGFPVDTAAVKGANVVYVLQFNGAIDKITTNVKPYTYTKNVFTTGAGVRASAFALKGGLGYITDWFHGHVVKLNLTTGASTTITVGHGPTAIVPNPVATALYFTNTGDGTVGVINSTTNTLVQTVKVGADPTRIGVNHAGTTAYVANTGDGTITPLTLGATAVAGTPVYVGGEPTSIAINSNDTLGFVTNLFCPEAATVCGPSGNNALGVVEVLTLKTHPIGVECCIVVGQDPIAAAFEPTGHYVWVVNGGNNSISVIDSFTNAVIGTFSTTANTFSFWQASSSFIRSEPK